MPKISLAALELAMKLWDRGKIDLEDLLSLQLASASYLRKLRRRWLANGTLKSQELSGKRGDAGSLEHQPSCSFEPSSGEEVSPSFSDGLIPVTLLPGFVMAIADRLEQLWQCWWYSKEGEILPYLPIPQSSLCCLD